MKFQYTWLQSQSFHHRNRLSQRIQNTSGWKNQKLNNKLLKGRHTYDAHENCLIFKTSHSPVHLHPKFCSPLHLQHPIFNEPPPSPANYRTKTALCIGTNKIKTKTKSRHICSSPTCNPCPNLKCFLPRFVICTPFWNLFAPIWNFFPRFEIPKASPICNPSFPDLKSRKPAPVCNPLIARFCNPENVFPLFRFSHFGTGIWTWITFDFVN